MSKHLKRTGWPFLGECAYAFTLGLFLFLPCVIVGILVREIVDGLAAGWRAGSMFREWFLQQEPK